MRALSLITALIAGAAEAAEHVVVVSVDGLRPQAIEALGPGGAPTFARLRAEGVWTHNARTDHDWTQTVPNHSCMVTGRPVEGAGGHNYTSNGDPDAGTTYHSVKGSYVTSIFDVVHDRGLTTAFYYNKTKLVLIEQSYDATSGAADVTGEDDGRDKIDFSEVSSDDTGAAITARFVAGLTANRFHLSFLHLVDPDREGHGGRWQSAEYFAAVGRVDGYLATVLAAVENDPILADETSVIVTADHGGAGGAHSDETDAENFIIPFYVWGADVPRPGDLYAANPLSRGDPGIARVPYGAPSQPVRNGDAANLALALLGLPPVPDAGAIINGGQDLTTVLPAARFACTLSRSERGSELTWDDLGGAFRYTVEVGDGTGWTEAAGTWPIAATGWTDPAPPVGARLYRVRAAD